MYLEDRVDWGLLQRRGLEPKMTACVDHPAQLHAYELEADLCEGQR